MSVSSAATIERSGPIVDELIQSRAEMGWSDLIIPQLVGELAVPTLVLDPRGLATQVIIVAGGAASGKSTLAEAMSNKLTEQGTRSATISSDDFVRGDRGDRRRWEAEGMQPEGKYDFDLMRQVIDEVCANQDPDRSVAAPQYDSHTGLAIDGDHRRHIPGVDVLIVEGDMLGELGQSPQALIPSHAYRSLSLYLHTPDNDRLIRRVERDMQQRKGHGETPEIIVNSFEQRQLTQHLPYTLTYASSANVIVTPAVDKARYDTPTYDMYTM